MEEAASEESTNDDCSSIAISDRKEEIWKDEDLLLEQSRRRSSLGFAASAFVQPDLKNLPRKARSEEMNVNRIMSDKTNSCRLIYSAILLSMEQDQLALQKREEKPLSLSGWRDALSSSFSDSNVVVTKEE